MNELRIVVKQLTYFNNILDDSKSIETLTQNQLTITDDTSDMQAPNVRT